MVDHPDLGPTIAPTGQFTSHVRKTLTQQHVVRPMMTNVAIQDFYISPNCTSHNVQDSGDCATRHLMTINELEELEGNGSIQLPGRDGLSKLANIKSATQGDNGKAMQSNYLGFSYQPANDYSADPNLRRVEVIRYFQKNRVVYLLGRQWVALNDWNQYNVLPFISDFYIRVPNRFYGLSVCDLVEPDQKLAEAIINGRIDELNLLIHPPLIIKEGRAFSAANSRLRPGVVWKADDPEHDYKRFEMGNVTNQAYIEVQALEQRVQKKTGVTDLSQGVATQGGNSALRSATGVAQQGASTDKKITYMVSTVEDQLIVPILGAMHAMNQIFLDPQEIHPQLQGGSAVLMDLETHARIEVSATYAAREYRTRITAHIDALRDAARGAGMSYHLLVTDQPLDGVLRQYLTIRQGRD